MKTNVGSYDRIFRVVLGIAIIAVGAYYQSYWGVFGVFTLLTALFRWCPAYVPFGFSTKSRDTVSTHKPVHP